MRTNSEKMHTRNFHVICVIFIAILSFVGCASRDIFCTTYNGYDKEVPLNLIYVKAAGDKDIIHYLWSTHKLPSVLVARTSTDVELKLDLKKITSFEKGGIEFTKEPFKVIGLTISEIWQKSYDKDTDSIEQVSSERALGLEFFQWSNMNNYTLHCDDNIATVTVKAANKDDESFSNNGTFNIKFSAAATKEIDTTPPHLIYNGNSSLLRMELDDLYSNASRTRYGVEITMFNSYAHNCSGYCEVVTTKSLSDEFSPGIFSDVDVLPPCDEKSSFISWRPVAYTSLETNVANSTDARLTSKCLPYSISNVQSIVELYFNERTTVSENVFNVTFGTVGDGFYRKTKFTSWTLMVGTGMAAHTKLSISVIIISSIGLFAVVLFFLSGGIFLTVRRCRKEDDDLLLSEHNVN